MRIRRGVWLGLVISGFVFILSAIALGVLALVCPTIGWKNYSVSKSVTKASDINEYTRYREMFYICSEDETQFGAGKCYELERALDGRTNTNTLLNLRLTTPAMQASAHGLSLVMVCAMAISLIVMTAQKSEPHPRHGQYTVLIGGSFVWLAAMVHFIAIVIWHITLDLEAFSPDASGIESAVRSWTEEQLNATTESYGEEYIMSWCSCGLAFIAAWSLLLAAYIQIPPTVLPEPKTKSKGNLYELNHTSDGVHETPQF